MFVACSERHICRRSITYSLSSIDALSVCLYSAETEGAGMHGAPHFTVLCPLWGDVSHTNVVVLLLYSPPTTVDFDDYSDSLLLILPLVRYVTRRAVGVLRRHHHHRCVNMCSARRWKHRLIPVKNHFFVFWFLLLFLVFVLAICKSTLDISVLGGALHASFSKTNPIF